MANVFLDTGLPAYKVGNEKARRVFNNSSKVWIEQIQIRKYKLPQPLIVRLLSRIRLIRDFPIKFSISEIRFYQNILYLLNIHSY